MKARPCGRPGCSAIVQHPIRYCPAHAPDATAPMRDYNRQRGSSTAQGYDSRWRRIRAAFLWRFPQCARCGGIATEAHHKTALKDGGTYHFENLMALCKQCHSSLTFSGKERGT
jgi:5-methylcytosine-specific restriction protein A